MKREANQTHQALPHSDKQLIAYQPQQFSVHFTLYCVLFLPFSFSALTSFLLLLMGPLPLWCLTKFNTSFFFSILFLLSDSGFLPLAFSLQQLYFALLGALLEHGNVHKQPPFSIMFFFSF